MSILLLSIILDTLTLKTIYPMREKNIYIFKSSNSKLILKDNADKYNFMDTLIMEKRKK